MAERRDWDRIKSLKPGHYRKVITDRGTGRGRAARDKRASRKLRNKRARASKRA